MKTSRIATISIFLLLILSSLNLGALSLDDALTGVPSEAVEALKADGETFRLDREGRGILLLPESPMAGEIVSRWVNLAPDVFTEALYLIPYPQGTDGIDLDVYNLTRKVSGISDVVYLSHRKKDYVPLFDDVYAVNDIRKKRPIDDPVVTSIPSSDTVLMHMKEVNLGSALYQVDYLWDGENLGFFLENLGALRYLIKVVDDNNMQINMIFVPTDEGFLVYGSCAVKLSNSKTVFNMMDPYTGFYRRLYAMVTWIYNTMHGTDRLPELKTPLDF